MDRYRGTCDIFFGIEHRLKEEEMAEKLNKQTKTGWSIPPDATRGSSASEAYVRSGICGNQKELGHRDWTKGHSRK